MEASEDIELQPAITASIGPPADGQENQPPHQQRKDCADKAARSTLKLLQLPKPRQLVATTGSDNRHPTEPSETVTQIEDTENVAGPRRVNRRRNGKSDPLMSPVAPLRCDHDVNTARLRLLGSKSRRTPLKTRLYVYEPAPRADRQDDCAVHNVADVDPRNVSITRAASAQTVNAVDEKGVQTLCVTSSPLSTHLPVGEVGTGNEQPDQASKRQGREIGVQCQLRESNQTRRSTRDAPNSIADRFPIWVDLNPGATGGTSNSDAPRTRYLHVATFTDNPLDTSTGTEIAPRPAIQLVRSDDNDIGESEALQEELTDTAALISQDKLQDNNAVQATAAAHRERYRLHYASNDAKTEVNTSDGGNQALIEVKNDMDRMKQRLLELEALADNMDYDFKLACQSLGGDKDTERDNDKFKARQTIGRIDQVLDSTVPDSARYNEESQSPLAAGVLTQKAAISAAAAREMLEQIEQLTLGSSEGIRSNTNVTTE